MRLPANQLIANKGSTHAQSGPRMLLKKARVFRNFSLIPSKRSLEGIHGYSYNDLPKKQMFMNLQSKMVRFKLVSCDLFGSVVGLH
jgi:hypothetical protein